AGIAPHPDNRNIFEIMNIPQNSDGFFIEDHVVMNPLHSNQAGIFVAGLTHSPQRLENTLMQASAVAGKIGVMFRSGKMFI
ncbi:MAG: hypothetical protein JSW07_13690, partial [bacterium]